MDNQVAVLRKQKHISQAKLAENAGISRPYLSAIERGKQLTISNVVMFRIANALQEPISNIFFAPTVLSTQRKENYKRR